MIPIKLSLKNFMCYREAALSFEGLHVACLCGNNGNGKSALLDAMTWVLWGKARAKTDDELIHLGKTEMEVDFEFALGSEHYRVIRKRTKPRLNRPGRSLLDLQIATDYQGFRSIAGNSIRETEQKIVEIMRMDYDTFINSAFLLQGRADEFTKKEPHKRKQVLADILGLSRYDELEKRAKEYARDREREKRDLENLIRSIDDELADKGEYEVQLREVGDAIAQLEKEVRERESTVNELARQKSELDIKKRQREELETQIKQARQMVVSFEGQVQNHRQRVEKFEKVLEGYQEEMAKIQAQLDELVKLEEGLARKREEAQQISNQIHLLTSTNARLREEMKELRDKLDMLSRDCLLYTSPSPRD